MYVASRQAAKDEPFEQLLERAVLRDLFRRLLLERKDSVLEFLQVLLAATSQDQLPSRTAQAANPERTFSFLSLNALCACLF